MNDLNVLPPRLIPIGTVDGGVLLPRCLEGEGLVSTIVLPRSAERTGYEADEPFAEELASVAAPDDLADSLPTTTNIDLEAIAGAVRTILAAVGEDPERPGLLDTPRRVARMYAEMFAGLRLDPARHLRVTFAESYRELVLVRDIPFTSMCEHHLLPFTGVAHVAYLPSDRVTGLSKLARVVEEVARRPQVQERMTETIASLVERELNSTGVAVLIKAEHSCMSMRGVCKPGSSTITRALRGVFRDDAARRAEVLALMGPQG